MPASSSDRRGESPSTGRSLIIGGRIVDLGGSGPLVFERQDRPDHLDRPWRQGPERVDLTVGRHDDLPATLHTLVADVGRRSTALTDLGHKRVIECTDPALAALIVNDRALRATCWPIGDRHIAIDPEQEQKFRTALRRLGYGIRSHA